MSLLETDTDKWWRICREKDAEIERLQEQIQQLHHEYPIARNAIIEECAQVAESCAVVTDYGREKIATAIRALKDKP